MIINPDNPSGNFIPLSQLMLLIEWAKECGVTIIVDESFVDFTENFQNNSLLHNDILEKYDNLLVVKSISKSYGVPGLRLGVLASGNRKLIDNMKKEVTPFEVGDTVRVHVRVIEGKRERIQMFEGVVLKKQHGGINESFTVRKLSSGIGVERTFPVHSPKVAQIDVVRRGKVRRAKLNYLRDRVGKAARVKSRD